MYKRQVVTNSVTNLSDNANGLVSYINDSILPEFERFVESGCLLYTSMQLEASGKPFVIVVNTTKPFAAETRLLCCLLYTSRCV